MSPKLGSLEALKPGEKPPEFDNDRYMLGEVFRDTQVAFCWEQGMRGMRVVFLHESGVCARETVTMDPTHPELAWQTLVECSPQEFEDTMRIISVAGAEVTLSARMRPDDGHWGPVLLMTPRAVCTLVEGAMCGALVQADDADTTVLN